MLLVTVLAILRNEVSLVGIERFTRRRRQDLNELLVTDIGKEPSDSTFRLMLSQCVDVAIVPGRRVSSGHRVGVQAV
jgi:hypothetical protein